MNWEFQWFHDSFRNVLIIKLALISTLVQKLEGVSRLTMELELSSGKLQSLVMTSRFIKELLLELWQWKRSFRIKSDIPELKIMSQFMQEQPFWEVKQSSDITVSSVVMYGWPNQFHLTQKYSTDLRSKSAIKFLHKSLTIFRTSLVTHHWLRFETFSGIQMWEYLPNFKAKIQVEVWRTDLPSTWSSKHWQEEKSSQEWNSSNQPAETLVSLWQWLLLCSTWISN